MQLFDVSLQMWLGEEASLCVFRREYGSAMALEHNGDLYSCGHFRVPRRGSVNPSPLGDGQVGWGCGPESSCERSVEGREVICAVPRSRACTRGGLLPCDFFVAVTARLGRGT